MTDRLAIIGKGAFGSALADVYGDRDLDHFGRDHPKKIKHRVAILAVPTSALPALLSNLEFGPETIPILCSKGMLASGAFSSTLLGDRPFAVLSGPGFADELSSGLPTIHSLAATNPDLAEALAETLSTTRFRLYWTTDVVGVQVCGTMKNILAIAAGAVTELGLGENARASLLVRGIEELRRAVMTLGGQSETLMAPAGIGDVFLTCTSEKSRNFRFGRIIARGVSAEDAVKTLGTVEGLHALGGLLQAVGENDAPIAAALNAVIYEGLAPKEAVDALMRRPIKPG